MDNKNVIKEWGIMTAGSFLVAAAVVFFMVPGNLVFGSVSGLSLILIQVIPIKISVMNLILNVFFLILGFLFVGREFGGKTVYTAVMIPVLMFVMEIIFPNQPSLTDNKWLDMLGCIYLVSAGQTLLFRVNASSGGLDIPAKMLHKFLHVELGKAVGIVGIVTVLSSVFVYDSSVVVAGIIGTYLNGRVVDDFISGFNRKKRVCILSEKSEEIQRFIREDINRGYTLYQAIGGYEKKEKLEIVTILAQNEYIRLLNYIRNTDPNAFVTVCSVNEVVGIWNLRGKAYRI
ncbi:MAG: YitT family protein [Schaedlerella sp.]|nr:YitT family protein [Schaedlerella sp.]